MTHRATPGDLEQGTGLKSGSTWYYSSKDHPKEWIDEENYFLSLRNWLTTADEIRVTCFKDDGTWDRAWYEVSLSDLRDVIVTRTTDWRAGGLATNPRLKAKHLGYGKWGLEDEHGKIVHRGLTKMQAEAMEGTGQPSQKAPKAQAEEQPADAA